MSDPAEVSELFASHYEFVSSRQLGSPQFLRYPRRQEVRELSFDTDEALPYNSPLTLLELEQCLSSSGDSAPGPDAIHYKMISRSHITVWQFLLDVFNKIWLSGSFRDSWQCAHVFSFSKPGKDVTVTADFRPISLTSNVGKLMEKMVNVRLKHYLESNKYIPSGQYCF